MKLITIALLFCCAAIAWAQAPTVAANEIQAVEKPEPLAFPGAEGFGAHTKGGRGGVVYVVTTCEDYAADEEPIPGSLRFGCERSGPRTIVFRVSGNIALKRPLVIREPFLTIAGQTAPGDGICVTRHGIYLAFTSQVIIRYLRVRPGDFVGIEHRNRGEDWSTDALSLTASQNVIFDHCSLSWASDEVCSITRDSSDRITVQWCIISESLNESTHSKGAHGYGSLICCEGKVTFHHNLYAFHLSRCPRPGGSAEDPILLDFRNNLIHCGGDGYTEGSPVHMNFVGNYHPTTPFKCYSGNLCRFYRKGDIGEIRSGAEQDKPFEVAPVRTTSAEKARDEVLEFAGALLPKRDAVDQRVVDLVRREEMRDLLKSQSDVGGWPQLRSAPAPNDEDEDGMPDEWENANGLDPKDSADRNGDLDGDGYTNLEEYLNALAPPVIDSGQVEKPHPGVETMDFVENYRSVVRSKDKDVYARAALNLRRWMIENDPHRPIYHFTGPESWINDPNGVIYHRGKYHLFYQFDPIVEGKRSKRCWGHAVSDDLVHWEDWPIALWPDTPYDRNGVYSGNMVIDDDGVPTALYTGNVEGHLEAYGMLARSRDGLLTWEKKMVMHNDQRPSEASPVHWDAQIWKDRGTWYQLIGGTENGKGAARIWSSPDLENWKHLKAIYSGEPGRYWELPYLVPFGEKYALLVGAGNPYWIGQFDKKSLSFEPDCQEPESIDKGAYYSFNLHMTDDKGPGGAKRQLMHGWVTGPESPTKTVPYWQGAHSIPRVVTLKGDRLYQQPIPEIRALRGRRHAFSNLRVGNPLAGLSGDALELKATFSPGATGTFGIRLRVSPDGADAVRVWCDAAKGVFGIAGRTFENPPQKAFLRPGEDVTMHVFLDRSIVEAYVNGRAQTARTFAGPEDTGLQIFREGGAAELKALDVWEMTSMWE